jgi:hypothetical protein
MRASTSIDKFGAASCFCMSNNDSVIEINFSRIPSAVLGTSCGPVYRSLTFLRLNPGTISDTGYPQERNRFVPEGEQASYACTDGQFILRVHNWCGGLLKTSCSDRNSKVIWWRSQTSQIRKSAWANAQWLAWPLACTATTHPDTVIFLGASPTDKMNI